MSQQVVDFLQNFYAEGELGDVNPIEAWWVERQEALEPVGYMLRPRYRPGWKPSWTDTDKQYFRCEDGQSKAVSVDFFCFMVPRFVS